MSKTFKIELGDKVAYSVQFLKSIGMSHSDMARARGEVTGFTPLGERRLVHIKWTNADMPEKVLEANLAKVGANLRFCAG